MTIIQPWNLEPEEYSIYNKTYKEVYDCVREPIGDERTTWKRGDILNNKYEDLAVKADKKVTPLVKSITDRLEEKIKKPQDETYMFDLKNLDLEGEADKP